MHWVQPTAPDPLVNRSAPNPDREQLPAGNHPVLTIGQDSNRAIRSMSPAFAPYDGVNAGLVHRGGRLIVHTAQAAGGRRARGALNVASLQRKRDSSPPVPPLALIP